MFYGKSLKQNNIEAQRIPHHLQKALLPELLDFEHNMV